MLTSTHWSFPAGPQGDAIGNDLIRLLSPFGWAVSWCGDPWNRRIDYFFKYTVFDPKSDFHNLTFGFTRTLDECVLARRDDKYLKQIPMLWATDVVRESVCKVQECYDKLTATEVDWRPTEAIPEDFYAM